jgi:hypothetical protein
VPHLDADLLSSLIGGILKTMKTKKFSGDKKVSVSLLWDWEHRIVDKYIGIIPRRIETYHLTLMTVLWSLGAVFFGYLAKFCSLWLLGVAATVILQYITDLFDGKLGKLRNTGLIKWGYFMDHFLDFIFLGSLFLAFYFLVAGGARFYLFLLFVITNGFWMISYLNFAATDRFQIAYGYVGPTEIRLFFVLVLCFLSFAGLNLLAFVLPLLVFLAAAGTSLSVFRVQKKLWLVDMVEKRRAEKQK